MVVLNLLDAVALLLWGLRMVHSGILRIMESLRTDSVATSVPRPLPR